MRRRITLAVDEELLERVRILAVRRKCSVPALIRDELTRLVTEDEEYELAKRAALERLDRGARFGAGALPPREALHDRAGLR